MDLFAGDIVVIPGNLPHEALMIGDVEEIDTWAPRARIGLIKQTIT